MTERHGLIHPRNNAPRRTSKRSKSKTFGQLLEDLRDRLLVGDVSWKELRGIAWTGDRYRLRYFRDLLVAARAIQVYKVGNALWVREGDQLDEVSVPELRPANNPVLLKSNKWPGKVQVECYGCNVVANRPFESEGAAKKWYWEVHVLGAVGHRGD